MYISRLKNTPKLSRPCVLDSNPTIRLQKFSSRNIAIIITKKALTPSVLI